MPVATLLLPLSQLPDPLPIAPVVRPFDVIITPPGSKSLTNRALLLAALANGTSTLRQALVDADDAQVMVRALSQLGAVVTPDPAEPTTLRITGVDGAWRISPGTEVRLDLHNAGTATRFLAAAAILPGKSSHQDSQHPCSPRGTIVIDGDARMRERPIGELVNALRELQTQVDDLGQPGYPPFRVHPSESMLRSGQEVVFGRTSSSQFVSALMLIAPWFPFGLAIRFAQAPTSEPYIAMTINLLEQLGIRVVDERPHRVFIGKAADPENQAPPSNARAPSARLQAFDLTIEPDASGATYPLAAAAVLPGARVHIPGLDTLHSLQGDARFVDILAQFGAPIESREQPAPFAGLAIAGDRIQKPASADDRTTPSGVTLIGPARLRPIDVDLSGMPDTTMTAAVIACFAQPITTGPANTRNTSATTTLRGLRTLRLKESDRLHALTHELSKIDAKVEVFEDNGDLGLRITPGPSLLALNAASLSFTASSQHSGYLLHSSTHLYPPVVLETYKDHRLAMAFAVLGLRRPNIQIRDPKCVEKTYPSFWKHFARFYGEGAAPAGVL